MRSDETWLAAHRAGGGAIELAGWVAAVLGGAAALLRAPDQRWTIALTLIAGAVFVLGVTYGGIRGVRAARRCTN